MTTTLFATVLEEFADSLERAKRDDGSTYYRRRDAAPEWVTSEVLHAIHEALDDRLPDDWVYETAAQVADTMTGYDHDDPDALRDSVAEIADGQVDVYTLDRVRWLGQHINNVALVDEACDELGRPETIADAIAYGQYRAIEAICYAIIQVCEDEAETRDE